MLNLRETRQYLKESEFENLFTQELGWDYSTEKTLNFPVDGTEYVLTAIAQKRGMAVFECSQTASEEHIPDYATRRKIQKEVAKYFHENFIIYTDVEKNTQIWQWVRREHGKPTACREHRYHTTQPGDLLIQKLESIAFSFEEEGQLTLFDVTSRVRASFDVERVTKKFYGHFEKEHAAFLKFLNGIPDEEMQRWYASVMLNRLMFIYFIQKKGFLDSDPNYLHTKLVQSQEQGTNRYYKEFLCPLFFEGFAKPEVERSRDVKRLLGKIPYLNGGIFQKHQLETLHGENIEIPDKAFEQLFKFFEQYQWHLDDRPLRNDNEINPDVLGYIFEKYINQKQMGAYYTKEDITDYISKNTIIPFLFDKARTACKIAFEGGSSVWQLLQEDPDRYIYDAVKNTIIPRRSSLTRHEQRVKSPLKAVHPSGNSYKKTPIATSTMLLKRVWNWSCRQTLQPELTMSPDVTTAGTHLHLMNTPYPRRSGGRSSHDGNAMRPSMPNSQMERSATSTT